jgi:hypothetical protein
VPLILGARAKFVIFLISFKNNNNKIIIKINTLSQTEAILSRAI